ncbi:MAG: Wzz/FepE/Etk N-terminal domain-containing protein [Campylobacter sp.]|nr:Wzz/FepE/Etk N-terminal domain-containing protein [Campylobacter sp.]
MQTNQNEIYDDEIDLIELFKTLWDGRIVIAICVAVFVVLGVIYILVATPWYKATALVETGYYKSGATQNNLLSETSATIEKLRISYIDLLEETEDKDAYVDSINEVKNNPSFFKITAFGKTNDLAKDIINLVVSDAASEHNNTLQTYLSTQKVTLANIDRQIEFLKNNRIVEVQTRIDNMQKITMPKLQRQIDYFEKVVIPMARKDVEVIDTINLPSLESRINLLNDDAKRYEDELKLLKNAKGSDFTIAIELIQEQNLNSNLSSTKNNLIALEQQREVLITKTKPELQNRLDRLTNIELVNLQSDMDKLRYDTLPALQRELYNLQTAELNALLDKRSIVEISLQPHSYKNTSIVSDIVVSQNPTKPKKLIILAVSLVLGGMIGVFVVLVRSKYCLYGYE